MAATYRRPGTDLNVSSLVGKQMIPEPLKKAFDEEPFRFDFVQLVRLIYLHQDQSIDLNRRMVGYENSPGEEAIRFVTSPRMRHVSSDVRDIQSKDDNRFQVQTSFLGLFGASGVLPHHYSSTILKQIKANDSAMQDFFDAFNHRFISHFLRAAVKYRLPYQHELFSRFLADTNETWRSERIARDTVSNSISSTVGLRDASLQDRLAIDDRNLMFFAGHFSNSRPTMLGLKSMLAEFSGLAAEILQFQFEWLYLDTADQTALGGDKALGVNAVIGSRVGSIQNRFRVRLGPMGWQRFQQLLPEGDSLRKITQFTRSYVGIGLDFDFQMLLDAREVPCTQLGNESCGRLGWNTWIKSGQSEGVVSDAIFYVPEFLHSN